MSLSEIKADKEAIVSEIKGDQRFISRITSIGITPGCKLLDIAFEEGRRHAVPVVLDTDAVLKRDKYAHLGMKCVTTQHFTDGVEMYGVVKDKEVLEIATGPGVIAKQLASTIPLVYTECKIAE